VTPTVTGNPPVLGSVSLSPAFVAGGTSATGTVTLSAPAQAGGFAVNLTSDQTAATVPSSVTVLQNATTAPFTVTTTSVASDTFATILATSGAVSKQAVLTVLSATNHGTVTGTVVSSSTSQSLSGAKVRASGSSSCSIIGGAGSYTAIADQSGFFTMTLPVSVCGGANYILTVSMHGYNDLTFFVNNLWLDETRNVGTISLVPFKPISGSVIDSSTFLPLRDVEVNFSGSTDPAVMTDVNGNFTLPVPFNGTFTFKKAGYVGDLSFCPATGPTTTSVGTRGLDPGVGTKVGCTLADGSRWGAADSPISVLGGMAVNGTLTIDPGVTVKFASPSTSLTARFDATGTAAQPIVFTASSGAIPGSWGFVAPQTGSRIGYAQFSYGGAGAAGSIQLVGGTDFSFDHISIQSSNGPAIYTDFIASYNSIPAVLTASITSSNISSTAGDGISVDGSGTMTIADTTISGSSGRGLVVGASTRVLWSDGAITGNGDYAATLASLTSSLDVSGTVIVAGNAGGQKDGVTFPGGTLSSSRSLGPVPWFVQAALTVPAGSTLTIGAGATIKMANAASITVNGVLAADGTLSNPITFTSSSAAPTPGIWSGMKFYGSAPGSRLSYATVSYAGGGSGAAAVFVQNPAGLALGHLTITSSSTDGLSAFYSPLTLDTCLIQGSGRAGITVQGSSFALTNATIRSSATQGINLLSPATVSVSSTLLDANGDYAIGADAAVQLQVTGVTAQNNGAGLKNSVGLRSGTVSGAAHWTSGITWDVLGAGITVAPGGSLTVDPGTTVRLAPPSSLLSLQGTFTAIGTSAAPITFTSNLASPAAGAWGGLFIANSAVSIAYASVRYGGNYDSCGIEIDAGAPLLNHVSITDTAGVGLSMNSATPQVPTLTGLSFARNTMGGIKNYNTSMTLDARLSNWDAVSGPSGSGPGTGQSVSTAVLFEPWLVSLPSSPQMVTSVAQTDRTINASIGMTTSLTFATALSGNWTVKILDASSNILRSFAGTGASGAATWDGKDSGGTMQPSGTYSYQIESVTSGGLAAAPARGLVILNPALPFTVQGAAATPSYFSPNGDGVQDTTTISASLGFDGPTWRVDVKNGGGTVVRSVTGSGRNVAFTWDGRDSGGVLQPDGTYSALISALDGTASATATIPVTLDVTAPQAAVTSPAAGGTVSNFYGTATDLVVTGTASDLNIANWALEVGAGATPSAWASLATGTGSVTAATLGTWSTVPATSSPVANGLYTLRLTVNDKAGNKSVVLVPQNVANLTVTQSGIEFSIFGPLETFTSSIPTTGTYTLVIKNPAGVVVRTLVNGVRAAGTYTDSWDGRNDSAVRMRDGLYLWVASFTDGTRTTTLDLTSQKRTDYDWVCDGAGEIPKFDFYNNLPFRIGVTLPGPGDVGIVFGPNVPFHCYGASCTPPWFCFGFDEYQGSGTFEFQWAGVDTTGAVRNDVREMSVISNRQNMSKNGFVMYGGKPVVKNLAATPAIFGPEHGTQAIAFDLATYMNEATTVTVEILNQESLSVLRTITATGVGSGRPSVTWDGRADNGMYVAPGLYTITLSATDSTGARGWAQVITTVQY
jgi:flagellar hook assembly protein FlgD